MSHDYLASAWCVICLFVWDTYASFYSDSHDSINPFLVLIFFFMYSRHFPIFF